MKKILLIMMILVTNIINAQGTFYNITKQVDLNYKTYKPFTDSKTNKIVEYTSNIAKIEIRQNSKQILIYIKGSESNYNYRETDNYYNVKSYNFKKVNEMSSAYSEVHNYLSAGDIAYQLDYSNYFFIVKNNCILLNYIDVNALLYYQ